MVTLRKFVSEFDKLVQQQHVNMALKLAKGQCGSMEVYNRQVGQIEGMSMSTSLLREMLGKLEDADDGGLPEM